LKLQGDSNLNPPHSKTSPGTLRVWSLALRLQSLPVALGPVLVGSALAYLRSGSIHPALTALAMAAALLMQMISNLQNDLGYTVRGCGHAGDHPGLPRATVNGWLSVRQLRIAIVFLALIGIAIGLTLVAYRGWPVLAIGVLSLLAALAYMGGPRPIAYSPLGELTVLLFFGLVAVLGTDWLLSGQISLGSVLAALAVGSLAAAALAVNNQRDVAHDRAAGRHTFAACFGESAARALFSALLLGAFLLLLPLAWISAAPLLLLPWILLAQALHLRHDFFCCAAGAGYNRILLRTFQLGLKFSVVLSLAAWLSRFRL